jgi:integrase/recombinase XerD
MAPEVNWRWIGRAAARLRSRAVPVRNKRSRLQSPAQLAALGMRLMANADSQELTVETAIAYRDGLTVALLAYRPLRARNLAMIRCDRHLVRRNDSWWLVFEAGETKAKRRLEFAILVDLAPGLERYLGTYRPVLLTRGGQQAPAPVMALWVSRDATALGYGTIAHHIRRRTRAAFGTELNPHLFRDSAATSIAIVDPEHVQIITAVLGHSTLATSEKYYNQAHSLAAGRRFHDTIEAIRRKGESPR